MIICTHLYCYLQLLEIQCDNPANVRTVSCSSGSATMGYEGDTCNFTCNTGYELTGSDTRTCQSNGSWSGGDNVCRRSKLFVLHNAVYHESFKAETFCSFRAFSMFAKLFYMKVQDVTGFTGKRKYEGFHKCFLQKSACTTCHETFLPQNFHGIQ